MMFPTVAIVLALLAVSGSWWLFTPTIIIRRALVLDFDRTITTEHLWRTLYDPHYQSSNERAQIPLSWTPVSRSLFEDHQHQNPYFPKPGAPDPSLILEKLAAPEAHDFLQYIYGNATRVDGLRSFFARMYKEGVTLVILSYGITREIVTTMKSVGLDVSVFQFICANSFGESRELEAWNATLGYLSVPWKSKTQMVEEIATKHDMTVYLDDNVQENNQMLSISSPHRLYRLSSPNHRLHVIGPQYQYPDFNRHYVMRGLEAREMDAVLYNFGFSR